VEKFPGCKPYGLNDTGKVSLKCMNENLSKHIDIRCRYSEAAGGHACKRNSIVIRTAGGTL